MQISKRYSVMVIENGAEHEVELCQLDGNPAPVVAALKRKVFGGSARIPQYAKIRVVDHQAEASP